MPTTTSIALSEETIAPAVETLEVELTAYLDNAGLPKNDILVPVIRRRPVFQNMPTVLANLTDEQKSTSAYISKFAAACAVGLFDAALNYLWNETVRNLRDKVAKFDLAYFFDSVVNDSKRRSKLKNESDLEKIDDWELIRGCHITGIITDNGFRHLDYVRNMRNYASAAHPNQNEITGLQIVGWLETCVIEVLAKEPAGPVIEVRRLLNSIRKEQISADNVPPITEGLSSLPEDLAHSLLRSVVGMYTDAGMDSRVKDNIRLLAQSIWDVVSYEARQEVGIKHATLLANGEVAKANLAREFIEFVDGQGFLTDTTLSAEMSIALDNLMTAHNGMNNFYTEAPLASSLHNLVPDSGDIPTTVLKKYVKTVTMCRIGNGYGVSWAAQGHYDDLLGQFSDKHIIHFIRLVQDSDVASRLQFRTCARSYQLLAARLKERAVRPRLKAMLIFVENYDENKISDIESDHNFRQLRKSLQI